VSYVLAAYGLTAVTLILYGLRLLRDKRALHWHQKSNSG